MTAPSNAAAPPATGPAMPARLLTRAGLWLWRRGVWLPLVLALLLAATALAWQARELQAKGRILLAAARAAASAPRAAAVPASAPDAERVAALRRLLPPAADATAQVRRLVELTRPQLAWQRAEFQQAEDGAGGLVRLQVTVPVAGEYAAMRQAIERALAALPQLSLDQVLLRRVQPDATRLEARLRFSIWLAAPGANGAASR